MSIYEKEKIIFDTCYTINLPEIKDHTNFSEDFKSFIHVIDCKNSGVQSGHYNTAIDILSTVLVRLYNSTDIKKLCETSVDHGSSEIFSEKLEQVLKEQKFKSSTNRIVLCSIKKILKLTSISNSFVDQINIKPSNIKLPDNDIRNAIPGKIKKLGSDSSKYKYIIKWIQILYKQSKINSISSIKQILYYVVSVFDKMNMDFSIKAEELNLDKFMSHSKNNRHVYYSKTFLKCIFNIEYNGNLELNPHSTFMKCDTDNHRLSVNELELIYKESCKNIRDKLFILILTTTGMRIGGLSCIKIKNISTVVNNTLIINDIGKTIEKNRKWFSFNINDTLKSLLWEWIETTRRVSIDNDYLFPGQRGGELSTNRIREIIKQLSKRAGVEGPHVHPHSFRHTFAHMLLECGNNIESIARMLGHTSSKTTEAYYLKESAAEVSKRSNIPWLIKDEKVIKIVPDFLKVNGSKDILNMDSEKEKIQKKRTRRKQLKEISKSLKHIPLEKITEE